MRYWSWAGIAAVLFLLPCASASATRAIKGGRYAGHTSYEPRQLGSIAFTISDSGKRLLPNAGLDSSVESQVAYPVPCTRKTADWGLAGDGVFARSGGAALHIDRTGRFKFRDTLHLAN